MTESSQKPNLVSTDMEDQMEMGGSSSNRRLHSPTPTCVSMKCDQSMDKPVNFRGGDKPSLRPSLLIPHISAERQRQAGAAYFFRMGGSSFTRRSHSPTPTCVSMKSDRSKGRPLNLTGGNSSTEHCHLGPIHLQMHQIHKSHLQKTFRDLIEGIPNQGDARLLHENYTELYITEGGRGMINDEHEVRQIERAFRTKAERGRPIKCSDIFKPLFGEDKPIRRVLTKGVAGIGKTVSVQKFILDWAEGKANQDVHFIFPLLFRELNLMREKKLSLVDLIQHLIPGMKDPTVFSSSQNRVMFILDGLDECRLPLDFRSNPRCCDVTKSASVDVLLTNLIKGNLLPSALLWITTRPAAANQIPPGCVNQVTQIWGFNDPQKEEYFWKRISDENLARKTITHLKSSRSLYIMCHIPVFCWISATVVERTSDESGKVEMPRTLTQMYTQFLIIQTSTKKEKYTERKETDEEITFKLGKLAFQQLEKGNLIFYEEDLSECGIDVTEASVYSGVCTQIFRKETGLNQVNVFSFGHLSIQEFFAALYVFLCFSNRERNMPDQQQAPQLSGLFRAATLHDLHKTAVDLALQSKNGHLDLFLRFLLGLSLESNQNLLRHLLPQTRSQSQSSEQTVQYVKHKIRDQKTSDRRINLFYCLNELNHHAVVEDIERSSGTLSVKMLLPGGWNTKRFKFEISEEFDLQKYMKTPGEDQTELLSPDDVLQKLVPGVTSALLSSCDLSHVSCGVLASALQQPHCPLRELDISDNNLMDSGVELLCSGLKSPSCKLEILRLSSCRLFLDSCGALASALQQPHCPLRELDFSDNNLMDSGVELLCSGLKSPSCKLEILRLSSCRLFFDSCGALASALQQPHCPLRELDISDNYLMDSGVELLCSGLKSPNCKLEILRLSGCGLTNRILKSVLDSYHSCLRKLDVSNNHLEDSVVNLLKERLEDPKYKLETLTGGWRPQTDTVFPEPSHTMKSDYLKNHPQSSLSQPQQFTSEGFVGGQPPDNKGEVEDVCNADDRECNEDVEVFTPESTASERTTYRFKCSSAGVHQCRYTGLVFKTDMAAEVQYQSVSWDYKKLDHEGLVAAGPLFKMKGLHGTVSQLGFPHCEIISSEKSPSLTVMHITGKTFEMLQPLRTSDTHVFLNITGFCEFGLAKKKQTEENSWVHALVLLFLNQPTLNILLLPRNVVLREVVEKRRKMTEPRIEIYVDTTSKCKLIPNEDYSLTCSSQKHRITPESAGFDDQPQEDYYPTFQVALTNLEPLDLYLNERRQNENGNVTKYDWQSYVNLQVYQNGGTRAESSLSSPYTPPGQDFFHKHKAALEARLGLLWPILSELQCCGVLNTHEREEVQSKESRTKQNQSLLFTLENKGGTAQEKFYRVLKKCDGCLVEDLERPHDYRTSAGYPSLLRDINNLTLQTAVC